MPSRVRASRTGSSLNGLMIAMMIFMVAFPRWASRERPNLVAVRNSSLLRVRFAGYQVPCHIPETG